MKKVLIVDDVPTNRKLLRVMLEAEGMQTMEAIDGLEALALLNGDEKPDAIISDILMPNMDGYRFCREVRRDPALRGIFFIFYTSTYTSPAEEKLAMECGADVYLKKPAHTREILKALNDFAGRSAAVPASPPPSITEDDVMKEYNEVLIRKLEERNAELEQAREAVSLANAGLERRVEERTAALLAVNKELEAFSYSVSHDLRAPLRHIIGFVHLLQADAGNALTEKSLHYLATITNSAERMGELIDDLLALSRISRTEMELIPLDLGRLVREIVAETKMHSTGRSIEWRIGHLPVLEADRSLLRLALVNLISNAVKFSGTRPSPIIEIGAVTGKLGEDVLFVRDNGVGFDPKYTHKLFGVFQRLHSTSEFEGTGIGLANVHRIIHRHHGKIWAEGAVDQGATFYFSIPKHNQGGSIAD